MNRILIFELNWMGDILFSFPFIRAVRGEYADAYIACVVVPRYVDLLMHNPWINDVHALSDDNTIFSLREKLEFVGMLRRERYDTCFFLKPSRTKTIMAEFSGIKERIGFRGKNNSLTKEVETPAGDVHRADQLLALAGACGVKEADGTYEYFLSDEQAERTDNLLHDAGAGSRKMVAVNPGGNWYAKRWPPENFIELSKRLLERFNDIEIIMTGSQKDVGLVEDMVSRVGGDRCHSTAGKTGINDLAALFKRCNLVVSADSGPLHLASAVGADVIALFGPTSPKITGPRGGGKNIIIQHDTGCVIPCYEPDCTKLNECMEAITVEEVTETAKTMLIDQAHRAETRNEDS